MLRRVDAQFPLLQLLQGLHPQMRQQADLAEKITKVMIQTAMMKMDSEVVADVTTQRDPDLRAVAGARPKLFLFKGQIIMVAVVRAHARCQKRNLI